MTGSELCGSEIYFVLYFIHNALLKIFIPVVYIKHSLISATSSAIPPTVYTNTVKCFPIFFFPQLFVV